MADISTVRSELLSIVGNNRLPIKTKRILIKKRLKAINTFIDLKPNKFYNQKKRKIYKILMSLSSIKYNVDLKKLLTKELINELTDFESYPDIIFDKKEDDKGKEYEKTFNDYIKKIYLQNNNNKSNFIESNNNDLPNKEILIETIPVDYEVELKKSDVLGKKKELDCDSNSDVSNEDSDVSDEDSNVSDEDSNVSDEDSDVSDEDSDATNEASDELDNTVNNLMDDLPDKEKVKLIIKLTKYKLEHEYNMEAENNRNIERMEELAIKKLKIKNKYKLKKLENRK
jgi:hypothetical protein